MSRRFLFATLAVPTSLKQLSRKGIQHTINQLPFDTATFIKREVQRLKLQPKVHADIAFHTLLWLSLAKEPLSTQAICEAFAVHEGDSELDRDMIPAPLFLEEFCMSFVQVDRESGIVRLVHKSFCDYLPDYLPLEQTPRFSDGESRLAIRCIQYLLLGHFRTGRCVSREDLSIRLTEYTFLRYAARHWGHYVQRCQSVEAEKHAKELLNDRERLAACLQVINEVPSKMMAEIVKDEEEETSEPQKASGLQIAVRFGLLGIIQDLIRNGDDVNEESSIGMRPIHEAARAGYDEVIEPLLAEGALTNVFDQKSRTPYV